MGIKSLTIPLESFAELDAQHRYWVPAPGGGGGRRQTPGFTQIATALSMLKKNAFWTEAGRDRGTRIHDACSDINNGVSDWTRIDPDIFDAVCSYDSWVFDWGFQALLSEKPLYSSIYGYAGKPDMFGLLSPEKTNRYAVIDLKSGAASKVTALQLAAYKQLISEATGIPLHLIHRYALQDLGSGRPKMVPFTDDSDLPVWLGLVAAFHWGVNRGLFTMESGA